MSLNQLHKQLKEKNIKFLFTDYYNTIVHRNVRPNYVKKIWAKLMIRELGLLISIDELYFIRQESIKYLIKKLDKIDAEINYDVLKEEICRRLINTEIISVDDKENFISLFEDIDVRSESNVQYINQDVVDALKYFKANGGKVYLVSDFYGSKSLFEKLLTHHGILDLFEGIYSSATLEKSKHAGSIYKSILSQLSINSSEVMMLGDNQRSDYTNAMKNGLNAYLLPNKKYRHYNHLGNEKKDLKHIINNIYKSCHKNASVPYTEYILFYHTFVERMYKTAKRKKIKDLFFLSREGQFLKKLFDSYQDFVQIDKDRKINTHYLRVSRQSTLQIALQDIHVEDFSYLQKRYSNISIYDFLLAVNCSDELRAKIIFELNIDGKTNVENFFSSAIFESLRQNKTFIDYYEKHRKENQNAFNLYIQSFNSDIDKNGVSIVDIGWGGTMQEALYKFFDYKIPITGYYLGLAEIYNIQPKTKRFGLNFSFLPYKDYSDYILMANMQLYEQFSAGNHGSALGYSLNAKDYTLQYHKPEEKWLYDNHIKAHQEEMYRLHKKLLGSLNSLCYSEKMMQDALVKTTIKIGLFQNSKKLRFLDTLSHGFYQNVGSNKVGISYKPPKFNKPIRGFVKFLITPEKYFRYLVKLKPMLYKKNKLLAFLTPMYFIYLYFGFNRYIRFNILQRLFRLKYNAFK